MRGQALRGVLRVLIARILYGESASVFSVDVRICIAAETQYGLAL